MFLRRNKREQGAVGCLAERVKRIHAVHQHLTQVDSCLEWLDQAQAVRVADEIGSLPQ
jgi:hypothetical protein